MEHRDLRIEGAGLLPLAERVVRPAAREEERAEQEVRGRIARVRLERASEHGIDSGRFGKT
jgi:hypothetical protein